MEKTILIASSSSDEHAHGPVSAILQAHGFPVAVYKTDKVLSGDEQFTLSITEGGELGITYQGTSISPESLSAGWYRKVANFSLPDAEQNLSKQLYMNNEVRALHDTIWPLFPSEMWLNAPTKIAEGERKLRQLMVAKEIGFTILETIVTNDWDAISSLQSRKNRPVAVKMMRGIIADNNQIKGFHTTPLDIAAIDNLKTSTVPFPGLIQPFADKYREWRVTTIGEDVFSAAIYTDETAKDDWRKHQSTPAVTFKDEHLADDVSEQCIQYLSKMGLQYGAFDFIEQPDGQIIFLECNPNGQYGWLEEDLGFPISQSIASHLMKIARQRN
jgi:hypothetical protein